ncbi:glycosyltransferase family 39 protein [Roseiflexus sp.]|uniref:glycosyltransferase family 39 protein n=1 Tax=Roseiflexus sp. TaxID=2562120 RepID=UPI0021DBCA8B|nr:glycosyltransferase family 39 protein [Roseiflexus sp.]GIW03052.1 MAG: hypothetical protein KatS3mg058_4455 [Roseiflexus sp.]
MKRTLVALFLIALAPRIWALNWGLPYVEHPDEPALVETAVRMVQEGDWNPRRFVYPSLSFYLLAGVVFLHAQWGIATGIYASIADLPLKTYLFTLAPDLYIWLRALTAILGAATVPLIYILARRMFDAPSAYLAALTLSVAEYHVQHAHFITTDAPTGLWTTLALLGIWNVAERGRLRDYVLTGIATGLAAGTKYQAGVVGLALGAAVAARLIDSRTTGELTRSEVTAHIRGIAVAAGLALIVFALTTPFAILDMSSFRRSIASTMTQYATNEGQGDFSGAWRLDGYARFFWEDGLLPSGVLLMAAGLPFLARCAPRQTMILIAAILVGLAPLAPQTVHFMRNTLPVFPLLILLASGATISLGRAIGRLQCLNSQPMKPQTVSNRVLMTLPIILGASALIAPQIQETTWRLSYWSRPYTLVQAADVLRAEPRGMLAAVEANPVQWANDPVVHPVESVSDHPPEWYLSRGYRYLLLNEDRRRNQENYARLLESGIPLLVMPPRDLGLQPGPGGIVLDMGERVDLMPFTRRSARFGDSIDLLGYELQPGDLRSRITPLEGANLRIFAPGQSLQLNLYWRALARMDRNLVLFIHINNQYDQRVAQRDLPLRLDDYPTSRWRVGELVIDRGDMPLPPLPEGEYRLLIGLYDAETGVRLPARDQTAVELTTIRVIHTAPSSN